MTSEAALAKLSYLLGKNYSIPEIKKLIETNMRGELTERKNEDLYEKQNKSFIKIVDDVLENHYPSTFQKKFMKKLEKSICAYITPTSTPQ